MLRPCVLTLAERASLPALQQQQKKTRVLTYFLIRAWPVTAARRDLPTATLGGNPGTIVLLIFVRVIPPPALNSARVAQYSSPRPPAVPPRRAGTTVHHHSSLATLGVLHARASFTLHVHVHGEPRPTSATRLSGRVGTTPAKPSPSTAFLVPGCALSSSLPLCPTSSLHAERRLFIFLVTRRRTCFFPVLFFDPLLLSVGHSFFLYFWLLRLACVSCIVMPVVV